MKFPKGGLQFYVASLDDIRFLWKAWGRQLVNEGHSKDWSALVYVMVEHRWPGEEVYLNFTAPPEVLDRYLTRLREEGCNFSCDELIPGFLTTCRVVHDCW
jgi:hypothetical protein